MCSSKSVTRSNLANFRTLAPAALGAALASANSASADVVSQTFFDPAVTADTTFGPSSVSFSIGAIGGPSSFTLHTTPYFAEFTKPDGSTKPAKPATASLSVSGDTRFWLSSRVSAGTLIDSSLDFSPNDVSFTEGNNYVGFRFSEDVTLYGWMSSSVTFEDDQAAVSLTGWGYDNAGNAIQAGQTAIPEPATTAAAMALVAGSAAMWHRRRNKRQTEAA